MIVHYRDNNIIYLKSNSSRSHSVLWTAKQVLIKKKGDITMLEIKNVTYGYKEGTPVMDDMSLEYKEPGVYGLLGLNGAGKTTLLYLMMGLLRPQRGTVEMDSKETWKRDPDMMSEMFIVPEEFDLPSAKLDQYVSTIRPFYPNFDMPLLKQMLEMFELTQLHGAHEGKDGVPEINMRHLSMGQKKKVYLCVALAARTKLLVMDEPTNGLDIPSKSQFRKVLAHGMREDQIIVISTHQVKDVENLLDHVTIVKDGKAIENKRLDVEEPTNVEEMFMKAIM